MTEVENIIFDLGGVLINLDYQKTRKAFENAGVVDFDSYYNQTKQKDLFNDYEIGKISNNAFLQQLKQLMNVNIEDDVIISCWNAMLMDLPLRRLNLLENINSKYRIFLLSNTNAIHIEAFGKYIENEYGYNKFLNLFQKVYYSNVLGMRKPNVETFKKVLLMNNLNPSQTIFIDDSIQHLEGAKAAGIRTIHHLTNSEISDTLKSHGLI